MEESLWRCDCCGALMKPEECEVHIAGQYFCSKCAPHAKQFAQRKWRQQVENPSYGHDFWSEERQQRWEKLCGVK